MDWAAPIKSFYNKHRERLALVESWGICLAAVLLATAVLLRHAGNVIYLDDSLITMAYARNAVAGLGVVYNPGEFVMGYSNPGYLLLLIVGCLLGAAPATAANLSFLGLSLGIVIAGWLLLHRDSAAVASALVPAWFFTQPLLWQSIKGMETPLLLFCGIGAFALLGAGWARLGAFLAAWAALSRPDGVVVPLVYMVIVAWRAFERRREARWWMEAVTCAAIIGSIGLSWVIVATWYYGSPLPMSVQAKRLHVLSGNDLLWEVARRDFIQPNMKMLAILGVGSLAWLILRPFSMGHSLGWGAINFGLLVAGKAPYYHWYLIPLAMCFLLHAVAGWMVLITWALRQELRWAVAPAAVIVLVVQGNVTSLRPSHVRQTLRAATDPGKSESALVINRQALPDALVAAGDAGFVGYYANRRILDTHGLMSPEVHPFVRNADPIGLYEEFRPDWIFGGFSFGSYLRNTNYRFVARPSNYDVFQRRVWDLDVMLEASPELVEALSAGEQVVLLDWATVAAPEATVRAHLQERFGRNAKVAFHRSGAIESLLGRADLRVFVPDASDDKVVPSREHEQVFAAAGTADWFTHDITGMESWKQVATFGLRLQADGNPTERHFTVHHRDPNAASFGPMPPYPVAGLLIQYTIEAPAPAWRSTELFVTAANVPNFSETTIVYLALNHDGESHVAYYPFSRMRQPPVGNLTRIRWDPVSGYTGARIRPERMIFVPAAP